MGDVNDSVASENDSDDNDTHDHYTASSAREYEADREAGFDIDIGAGDSEFGKRTESAANMASWVGRPSVKGSTETMRMALLTFSLVGLQYGFYISL